MTAAERGQGITRPATIEQAADGPRNVEHVSWPHMDELVSWVAELVGHDGAPEVLVAILRGGAVPAVCLSHRLGLRDVRAVEVVHTVDDSVHAPKSLELAAVNPASLGDLAGKDVLIVDDVAGTGQTLLAAASLVSRAGALRVRTAVCVVNADNWVGPRPAESVVDYIGVTIRGWVVFPWESNHEH